jgi:hypothetical protein
VNHGQIDDALDPASRTTFSAISACVNSSEVTALSRKNADTPANALRKLSGSIKSPLTTSTPAGKFALAGSRRVVELESSLGLRLFERGARLLKLTE